MKSLVCDTGPVNYLVQIDCIRVLPSLFQTVFLSATAHRELLAAEAPDSVRLWAERLPSWVERREVGSRLALSSRGLSVADLDAVTLAIETGSCVLLDDLAARRLAQEMGIRVVGTLGILELASRKGLVSLRGAVERLRQTNIHVTESLYRQVLDRNPE